MSVAKDFSRLRQMFEIGYRRVGIYREMVLASHVVGCIGHGQLDDVQGSTDILIPAGGSVSDALVFVPENNTRRVRVFDMSTGVLVRDLVGDGQLSTSLGDVLIADTGPQGSPELYLCDRGNHRVIVLDPLSGMHIRDIGRGLGSG